MDCANEAAALHAGSLVQLESPARILCCLNKIVLNATEPLRIRPAATSGRAMNAACEPPLADSTVAFIRLAMNLSQSGGMALSCSETMYQAGISSSQRTVAFSVRAAALRGRCVGAEPHPFR
jgi:hypothetical protein